MNWFPAALLKAYYRQAGLSANTVLFADVQSGFPQNCRLTCGITARRVPDSFAGNAGRSCMAAAKLMPAVRRVLE